MKTVIIGFCVLMIAGCAGQTMAMARVTPKPEPVKQVAVIGSPDDLDIMRDINYPFEISFVPTDPEGRASLFKKELEIRTKHFEEQIKMISNNYLIQIDLLQNKLDQEVEKNKLAGAEIKGLEKGAAARKIRPDDPSTYWHYIALILGGGGLGREVVRRKKSQNQLEEYENNLAEYARDNPEAEAQKVWAAMTGDNK
jgi:hypothetical protein